MKRLHLRLLTLSLPVLLVACNSGTSTPYPATATPQAETIITNGQTLTIERSSDEYAAYGSVSIPRSKAGLANALALKAEVDALVTDLNNQNALGVLH
jgi:hypothetical protein